MGKYQIKTILKQRAEDFKDNEYIFEKNDNEFKGITYDKFVNDVYNFAGYLQSLNLCHKKIGLLGKNSYNYMVSDIAVMGFVGTGVAISCEWKLNDIDYVLNYLKIEALIYSETLKETVEKLMIKYPEIIFIKMDEVIKEEKYPLIDDLIEPDMCSKIIFSSGTTSSPKAVMLSQNNMFACWDNLKRRADMNKEDICYLFLPLHHTYAGICNFLYSLDSGMKIYLCGGITKILEELETVKPTVFCGVPLIFNRFYETCINYRLNINKMLGGNIKYLFCGGAYFEPEIRQFYKVNGLNMLEAYGLSETSSLVSVEYSNRDDFESVGTIMENLDVFIEQPDINGIGEILVKGDNVFMGYYGNKQLTKSVMTENGYFRTGDLGYIADNKLYLKGRKKRVIVLDNAENIYPDEIEVLFYNYEDINKVKVYEKDKMLFATVYIKKRIDVNEIIKKINAQLPKYAEINNYEVIEDSLNTRIK